MTISKILVIEDDGFIGKAFKHQLKQDELDVVLAENGKEAIKALKKSKPDIILLDIIMPVMNGFDFLKEIQKNDDWSNIPIIVLTNLGQNEDQDHAKQYKSVKEFIVKADASFSDVRATISKYLKA